MVGGMLLGDSGPLDLMDGWGYASGRFWTTRPDGWLGIMLLRDSGPLDLMDSLLPFNSAFFKYKLFYMANMFCLFDGFRMDGWGYASERFWTTRPDEWLGICFWEILDNST